MPNPPESITVIPRRRPGDCGLWALSCLLSKPYEEVFLAASKVDRHIGERGLWMTQIMQIADRLGYPMRQRRSFNLHTSTGILGLYLGNYGHVCILKQGQVIDTDLTVTDVECYIKTRRACITSLLVLK